MTINIRLADITIICIARKWCEKTYRPIPLIDIRNRNGILAGGRYNSGSNRVYDEKKATWIQRQRDSALFKFKDESLASMFILQFSQHISTINRKQINQ